MVTVSLGLIYNTHTKKMYLHIIHPSPECKDFICELSTGEFQMIAHHYNVRKIMLDRDEFNTILNP